MVFIGAPGTGKTQVARIVARVMAERRGNGRDICFVEATRKDFVAEYQGQTPAKTRRLLERARGGVLFVDEAYSLIAGDGLHDDYGREALAELVAFMEAERSNTIVIFAGYRDDMLRLLDVNEGLRSRVRIQIEFPS